MEFKLLVVIPDDNPNLPSIVRDFRAELMEMSNTLREEFDDDRITATGFIDLVPCA